MGYTTYYSLNIHIDDEKLNEDEKEKLWDKIFDDFCNNNDDADYFLRQGGGGNWRNHEKDLQEFSKKYPMAIFELEGEGDEKLDIWVVFAKDGKIQDDEVKIEYPTFNPERLHD